MDKSQQKYLLKNVPSTKRHINFYNRVERFPGLCLQE